MRINSQTMNAVDANASAAAPRRNGNSGDDSSARMHPARKNAACVRAAMRAGLRALGEAWRLRRNGRGARMARSAVPKRGEAERGGSPERGGRQRGRRGCGHHPGDIGDIA
ncbi:hypothetical protein [Lysobacter enzymogenes]|uniref:hypothetical protein n=2 Tax=Lysobacter enzymogenes TaxID=69 RepID=UPI001114489D|nr:hypothetical protein [Lysobacter enzymogenes]